MKLQKTHSDEYFTVEEDIQYGDRKIRSGQYRRRFRDDAATSWYFFHDGRWKNLGERDNDKLEELYETMG
jgi:hypothetical protein